MVIQCKIFGKDKIITDDRKYRRGYIHATVAILDYLFHHEKRMSESTRKALYAFEDAIMDWRDRQPDGLTPPPTFQDALLRAEEIVKEEDNE